MTVTETVRNERNYVNEAKCISRINFDKKKVPLYTFFAKKKS